LEADRGQYGSVSGNCLDRASTPSRNIDKNLAQLAGFKEAKASGVSVSGVLEIHELVQPSLRKPSALS